MRTEVYYEQLAPDPFQVRRSHERIGSLAGSIKDHGLLENLVVRENPKKPGYYIITAGERRWLAIGRLIESGDWDREKKLPVLVSGGESIFENIIENTEREEVPSWEIGRRFVEILDAGHTQPQIAERIGKSQGYVSRHVIIARGLHPKTIDFFQKAKMKPAASDLSRIAGLLKPDGTPDVEAQLIAAKKLQGLIGKRRRRPHSRNRTEPETIVARFKKLERDVPVPPHAVPYVEAVLRYLKGEDQKLRFKL